VNLSATTFINNIESIFCHVVLRKRKSLEDCSVDLDAAFHVIMMSRFAPAATPDHRTQLDQLLNTNLPPLHILPSTQFLATRIILRRTSYHDNWIELAIDKPCQECVPDCRLAKDASVSPTNPYGHSYCDTFNIVFTAAGAAYGALLLDNMRDISSDDRRDRSKEGPHSLLPSH
jgi:hypothetical protein